MQNNQLHLTSTWQESPNLPQTFQFISSRMRSCATHLVGSHSLSLILDDDPQIQPKPG